MSNPIKLKWKIAEPPTDSYHTRAWPHADNEDNKCLFTIRCETLRGPYDPFDMAQRLECSYTFELAKSENLEKHGLFLRVLMADYSVGKAWIWKLAKPKFNSLKEAKAWAQGMTIRYPERLPRKE